MGGFKDLFIKPEENPQPKRNDVPKASESRYQQPVDNRNAVDIPTGTVNTDNISKPVESVSTTETNTDIIRKLWEVLVAKNLPGPDYLEIRNSAAALESMNMPVNQRYEAAFKMLKASYPNFTKEHLMSSIDTYISFVNEELKEGMEQCSLKREKEINGKSAQIEQMKEQSQKILEDIEKKKAEYNEILTSIQSIESVLNESRSKLEKEELIFKNSINSVIDTLTTDKQIMSNLNI